jgi:hypothetical protein
LQCESFVCRRPGGASCGQCAAPLGLGDDCAGAGNLIGSPCGPGRVCADDVCVALGDTGEACDATTAPCYVDLGCVGGVCGPPAQEGEACTALLGECDLWGAALVCNPFTSTCIAGAFAQPGEDCGVEGPVPTACAASNCFPSALSGTCMAQAADGEACDPTEGPACQAHAQCVDGVCEQFFTPVCE